MKIRTPRHDWQSYKFGTISLCMIMRDDAKVLSRCLDSIVGLVDEIIIVDTGSKDNSVEIARSYGAKVYFDPWQDDFARPRNIGLKQATGQWILIMDPDETISREHHKDLKWLTRAKNFDAFWITTNNYGPYTYKIDYKFVPKGGDPLGKYEGFTPSTKTRFFKNGLGIVFEGCWHELVDYYIKRKGIRQGSAPIPVHHWVGEISQASRKAKSKFYLAMGEKKTREQPRDGQAHWELATAEMIAGLRDRASKSLVKAWRLGFNVVAQYYGLSRCQRLEGNAEMADLAFEKGVCAQYPALTHIDPEKRPLSVMLDSIDHPKKDPYAR